MAFAHRILGATISDSPGTPCLFYLCLCVFACAVPSTWNALPNMPANEIPAHSFRPITSGTLFLT